MQRTDGAGHVNGRFVGEDAALNRPPTELTPDWFNAVQEELAHLVESAGMQLDKADNAQVLAALGRMFATPAGVRGQSYTAFVATGAAPDFAISATPAPALYIANQRYRVQFPAAGGADNTLNVNGLGARHLKQYDSLGVKVPARIAAGQLADVDFDGVDFVVLNPLPAGQRMAIAGGTAGAITATYAPALITLTSGLTVAVRASAANTSTAPTFKPNDLVAKAIVKGVNSPLVAGDIAGDGYWIVLCYDQPLDKWVLINPATGVASASQDAGAVVAFARNTAPSGYLKANGAAVSRATYAALFAAVGTAFGVGDGVSTFNLPDLRGEFVRGWDDGRGVDLGRAFGSAQDDLFRSHSHTYTSPMASGTASRSTGSDSITHSTYTSGLAGGSETRPRNVALLICIKY